MAIRQLSLTDFRNLEQAMLEFHETLNLVCGANGSGKTSLLEAIFVLCQAQSFRTHQLKQCIRHDRDAFVVFGRFDGYKAGVSKTRQKLEIHVNETPVKRRSELVRQSPVHVVNAGSFDLIDGPPAKRRRYLDWCLFHVEQDYADSWVGFQHALKQRNRLLKSRQDLHLLEYWDQHLCTPSVHIDQMRRRYAKELADLLITNFSGLLSDIPARIAYHPGWSQDLDLLEVLKHDRERDRRAGFTHSGIHRADLKFEVDGKPVDEVLSRGQSKRFCLALMLAALKLVGRYSDKRILLLIDDLHSELDTEAQALIYRHLEHLDVQLFVSNIESSVPAPLATKEFKMFHVEHGTITAQNFG